MSGDPERTIERIAHAFDPAGWSRRSLVAASVALPVVLGVTVGQRALVADSPAEWVLTGIHGALVVIGVPLLLRRVWRERRDQAEMGVPE